MMNEINNILFDLDGTLTNPKEGIVNSILYALKRLNIREDIISDLDTFIGPPLRESFAIRYNLPDSLADKAISLYREYFAVKGIFENELYPGVTELLKSLASREYQLFVATSKPTVYAVRILRHFNLSPYFTEITGSNLDNTRTDKTEIISHIVSVHQLNTSRSVMVGDRKHDIIGAKNNSMKTIVVAYGYGSLQELLAQQPDYIVHDCRELESLILNSLPVAKTGHKR